MLFWGLGILLFPLCWRLGSLLFPPSGSYSRGFLLAMIFLCLCLLLFSLYLLWPRTRTWSHPLFSGLQGLLARARKEVLSLLGGRSLPPPLAGLLGTLCHSLGQRGPLGEPYFSGLIFLFFLPTWIPPLCLLWEFSRGALHYFPLTLVLLLLPTWFSLLLELLGQHSLGVQRNLEQCFSLERRGHDFLLHFRPHLPPETQRALGEAWQRRISFQAQVFSLREILSFLSPFYAFHRHLIFLLAWSLKLFA